MNRKNALLRSTPITILNDETISAAELLSELNEVTYIRAVASSPASPAMAGPVLA